MVKTIRDDLVVIGKQAKGAGKLTGKLCLVLRVSSAVRLITVSPSREFDVASQCTELHSDTYWRGESSYRLFLSSRRLVRFVVLDVELCDDERDRYNSGDSDQVYEGPQSGVSKYALADVEVARETDFGVNDETFMCVTHLGHLLSPGDVVLGYDLASTVLSSEAEWSIENDVTSNFVMPDIVLVKKIKGGQDQSRADGGDDSAESKHKKGKAKSSGSKKRDRRMKKEEQKQQKLAAAAARMGLNTDEDVYYDEDDFIDGEGNTISEAVRKENEKFEKEVEMDEDLADDLAIVEAELREQSFSDNEDDESEKVDA